jgi:hypothetical protein
MTMNKLREVFSVEECEIINKMQQDGQIDFISSILDMDSPRKERALQEFLDEFRGQLPSPEGSVVRQEMERRLARGEEIISSPEDEAEWQSLLDREAKGEKISFEKDMTRAQLIIALENKGIEFDPKLKKAELKQLLINAE